MFLIRLLFIAFLASGLSTANASEGVQQLLNKMNHTLERADYEGTFVFMQNDNVETMSIIHGYSSDGVKEKLVSLNGDAREVIRDQDVLTCIWPKDKLVVIETAKSSYGLQFSLPKNLNELVLHYKLIEVGKARIAGHDCSMVRFEALDEFRYGHELCVNEKHGMLLESKTFDANNKIIESMMFTSFRMRDIAPDNLFEPSVHLNDYTWKTAGVELNEELQPDRAWKIKNLPPGFTLSSVSRRLMSASKNPIQHMILTDGLASVSVFIRKNDASQQAYKGAHKKGIINAFARDLNQHQITVVGEVPERTVEMIGASVFYSNH